MEFEPIGVFHGGARYPYDAARQPTQATAGGGWIALHPQRDFEQALQDLSGFSHVWLLYHFHQNSNWKPMVMPPRATRKVGVFASRAPYRPNPIGLSCVGLLGVAGLRVEVGPCDLLDGTPILDIKPYLPYADSVPDARVGWLEELNQRVWHVTLSPAATAQLDWLEAQGEVRLRPFLEQQLCEQPFDTARKRIRPLGENRWEIAYRTWRIAYAEETDAATLAVQSVGSGYTSEDLALTEDRHGDKALHRAFQAAFPAAD